MPFRERSRIGLVVALAQLQEQVLGSYFKNMRDSLKGMTPEQMERTRQMIRDLNRSLKAALSFSGVGILL